MWQKLVSLVVAAGIITGSVFLYKNRQRLFQPDFDRTGGTLLVFEVDGDLPAGGLAPLVEALQKRYADGSGVVVRPDGERRVAVGVPAGRRHDDLVERVKRTAALPGRLQFRLFANSSDDAAAVAAATLPAGGAKLDRPPAAPRNARGGDTFAAGLPGPEYRYRWAPLGEPLTRMLALDPTGLRHANPFDQPFVEMSARTGRAFVPQTLAFRLMQARVLRPGADPVLFVLLREPQPGEEDPAGAVDTVRGTGQRGRYAVQFRLSPPAAGWVNQLVHGQPTLGGAGRDRPLAVLLDGQVLAAPYLGGGVRELSTGGELGEDDATDLAALLRGGPLPCRLKARPVRQSAVPAKR
jgi:hypothetical protein